MAKQKPGGVGLDGQNHLSRKTGRISVQAMETLETKTWKQGSITSSQIIMAFEIEIYHFVMSAYWI